MEFRLKDLPAKERYRLLIGLVVPRPIALITTRGEDGTDNAAPFSFFNVMGEDPPVVVVSLEARADGALKDTARNIARSRQFAVNLVDEPMANAMHACGSDLPSHQSELDHAGLPRLDCRDIACARIANAPASLECVELQTVEMGKGRRIVIGEVLLMHVRDGILAPDGRFLDGAYRPVGRLYGNLYATTRQRFSLPGDLPEG